MLPTDKKDFARVMVSCFQNYRANISEEMIVEWFESKLYGFTFCAVSKAFGEYVDNYKNKFPPTRGAIIHLALCASSNQKYVENKERGCINLVNENLCGKEIEVMRYCRECHESIRPKNNVELQCEARRKKDLEEDFKRAKLNGCKTENEIYAWLKNEFLKKIAGSSLERLLLGGEKKSREELLRESDEKLEKAIEDFKTRKCAPHNNPETFNKISELIRF